MFRFEHPIYLWALAILPLLVLFFALAWRYRRRALAQFANPELLPRLAPGISGPRHRTKFLLLLGAILLLIIGLANPQWAGQRERVTRRGIEVVIALDISRSMLANDVQPNRLERAKRFAQQLVAQLAGNQMGLVFFACTASTESPLTTDYAFLQQLLSSASADQAMAQGTALGDAIEKAQQLFAPESANHRALIVLSDGEDHLGRAADIARLAREQGLLVYTVGAGLAEGGLIPISDFGDYLRDAAGAPIRTRLDAATLEAVATAGGGTYYSLANESADLLTNLQQQINRIEKQEYEERSFQHYASYFPLFIGPALLLLLIDYLLAYRRTAASEEL